MKRILLLALAMMVLSTTLGMVAFAETTPATFLFVATDGADSNNGAEATPFKTLGAAVEAARQYEGTVVINLREGEYTAEKTISLTAQDQDLVIRAYPGEEVSINGGTYLPYGDFKTVTDEAVLGRIVDRAARTKIQSLNLKDYGVTDFGEMKIQGFLTADEQGYASTLSYKDKFLTIAQYPNGSEYLYTDLIIKDGKDTDPVKGNLVEITYTLKDTQRYKKWEKAEDLWAFSFIVHDWADATVPAKFDFKTGQVTSYTGKGYYPVSDRRVKFMNLLEELDQPGEWYLDRATGELYLYAPAGIQSAEKLLFTSYEAPFFTIIESKNIKIEGIRFAGTRARGVEVQKADGVVINNCEFTNIGDCVVMFDQCVNSGVENSYLHDLGSWGIYLNKCGDKQTLTPGNCFVTNNEIRTFSQYRRTYSPAIHLFEDVGNSVTYNEIHDAPHFAIRYDSNDMTMEYNEFYDVCQDTADCGAVYTGRYWNTWGNKVRYNYFHDLKMIDTTTGHKVWALYLDDQHSQTDTIGNVFYNVEYVALMGGGRNNKFINNLMIDCANPLKFDARGVTWNQDGITNNTNKVDWHTEVWAKKYPELMNLNEDESRLPKYNVLTGNVLMNTPPFNLDNEVVEYSTVENNITISDKKAFVDYANKNFALSEDSSIFKQLPDFEPIPFDKIGRFEYTYEEKYTDKGGVKPVDPSVEEGVKIYVNGQKLDFTGDQAPFIQSDRTLVPMRKIFEALGATVSWDEATRTATSEKNGVVIKLTIDSNEMFVNDDVVILDVVAQQINDRTMFPLRAISENLGYTVGWEEETQTVTITE